MRLRSRAGFTLMEMLLVAMLLPVIFFTVFANMSSGMRAWKAFNRPVSEEGTAVFLDHTQFDFANAFQYTPLPFTGDAVSVSFAAPVPGPPELGGDRGIGRVGYRYDPSRKAILREEEDMSALYKNAPPRQKVALGGVAGLKLEYLTFVPADSSYNWQSEWQPSKRPIPPAVRLTIDLDSGETLSKTYLVPCGN